jgi:hypothetical protein
LRNVVDIINGSSGQTGWRGAAFDRGTTPENMCFGRASAL